MHRPLHFALEAHPTAATLFIEGTLASPEAVRAVRGCYDLPSRVRHLTVDLRRARLSGRDAADTLGTLLDCWRCERRGTVRIEAPGVEPPADPADRWANRAERARAAPARHS